MVNTSFKLAKLYRILGFTMIRKYFSVTTSFVAVYLTYRRNPNFALAYALNDIVLIVLWALASMHEIRYVSVVVCFAAFLANDIYSYKGSGNIKKVQGDVNQFLRINLQSPFPLCTLPHPPQNNPKNTKIPRL